MTGAEEFLHKLDVLMKQSASWPLPLALAVLALAPALCEEAAFRGVMLSGLSRTGSRAVAVVGSALTFGILHIHPVHALIPRRWASCSAMPRCARARCWRECSSTS
jgi:sodium transport system permease protein